MVELGIVTPVLTLLPGAHAPWERDGDLQDVAVIARAADSLGYHHLTCSEHVALPTGIAEIRGGTYWDPLATLGYLAAHTSRIRLATSVVVIGYHHPLEIAKRYGTLDRVSNGRLVLGVGVGSLEEEFDLLDVSFPDRGARADDAMRALRVSLSTTTPSYAGDYVSFDDVIVDPCALQARVPLWVGGRTARSLRRAVELGDGWMPFGLDPEEMSAMVGLARSSEAWAQRPEPLDLVLQRERAFDPLGDRDGSLAAAQALLDCGATMLSLRFVHRSRDHYVEQMQAMVDLVADLAPLDV